MIVQGFFSGIIGENVARRPKAKREDWRDATACKRLIIQTAGELRPTPNSASQQERVKVEPLSEALRLLRRQSELEDATRRPGGIRVVEEREICALREKLKHCPSLCGLSSTPRAGCIAPWRLFQGAMQKPGGESAL